MNKVENHCTRLPSVRRIVPVLKSLAKWLCISELQYPLIASREHSHVRELLSVSDKCSQLPFTVGPL